MRVQGVPFSNIMSAVSGEDDRWQSFFTTARGVEQACPFDTPLHACASSNIFVAVSLALSESASERSTLLGRAADASTIEAGAALVFEAVASFRGAEGCSTFGVATWVGAFVALDAHAPDPIARMAIK